MAEIHLIPFALAPDADRYNTNPTTDWIRHPGVGNLYFLIVEGAGGTGTATITANASASASGGSTTALKFLYKTVTAGADFDTFGGYTEATTSGITPAAGANKSTLVKIRFDALPEGKPFVSLTLTEVANSEVDAAVIAFCDAPARPGSGVSQLA